MKAYKIIASGSYRIAKNDIVSFSDLEVIIPFNDIDVVEQALIKRFAPMMIMKNSKRFPDRLKTIREVFIDEIEEIDHKFSFYSKDIKKMEYEELMDLAAAYHLYTIPLYKKTSIRVAREKAYLVYSDKVLGKEIDPKAATYDYMSLPPLKAEAPFKADRERKLTNAEVLRGELKESNSRGETKEVVAETMPSSQGSSLSLSDLKAIADSKKIQYNPNIGYDKLYERVFKVA